MKLVFAVIITLFVLAGCAPQVLQEVAAPMKVVALSGSLAQAWVLAGGDLAGTTQDAFEFLDLGVEDIGSLHNPSFEKILEISPDLVILSSDIPSHAKLYEQLKDTGIATASFSVETFEDYLRMMKTLTDITGRADLYKKNGTDIRERIDAAIEKSKGHAAPKVLFVRAASAKAAARNSGTMAGAMLKDLGCINIADSNDSLLEDLSMEIIIQADPDFIFLVPMGESEEKSLQTADALLVSNPAWAGLSAVKNGRYFILAKDLFHQKPNNRWGESYEILEKILYE
ncbi:hypothetical protein AGMMS49975_12260 [Clostridia bacterium]|nr:hypothetical protein AGMMS49975_12260 [Clostridia bacterium]